MDDKMNKKRAIEIIKEEILVLDIALQAMSDSEYVEEWEKDKKAFQFILKAIENEDREWDEKKEDKRGGYEGPTKTQPPTDQQIPKINPSSQTGASLSGLFGVSLIAAERARQINEEEWTPEYDDRHTRDELVQAAACYALPQLTSFDWPWWRYDKDIDKWTPLFWKPTPNDRIQELTKAGALIAAEIDRLLRKGRK